MKKLLLALLFILTLTPTLVFSQVSQFTTLTGQFIDTQGNPLTGSISMRIPYAGLVTVEQSFVSPAPVTFSLYNGQIIGPASVIPNSDILPSGTYYITSLYDSSNSLIATSNVVVSGSTFNMGSAVQTSVTTANISFANLAVNILPLNNIFTGTNKFASSGTFTNTQMNLYVQSILNSCSPFTEWQSTQGAHFTTEAITGCVAVPVGSTQYVATGLAGYINSSSTTSTVVGVYGQARSLVVNAHVFGANFVASDNGNSNNEVVGTEIDIRSTNSASQGAGLLFAGTLQPSNLFSAIAIAAPTTAPWQQGISFQPAGGLFACKFCIDFQTGATPTPLGSTAGIIFNPVATGASQASQGFTFVATDGSSVQQTSALNMRADGNMQISGTVPNTGLVAPNVNSGGVGPTLNNSKYVDGTTYATTGAVADTCENYPTNNGLRTCVINSPPELITVNPFPPNFSVEWRIMPGSVNSTVSNSTNINSIVTAVPLIFGSNASIYGLAGPVGSSGNFSGGSAIIASDTYPPALGVPTGGAVITCNGGGGLNAPFIAVRMVNNLQSHPGASPASGFGAYVKKTGCAGVASIDISAPTGFNAGALTPVDFEVGVSATLNGVYYLQVPGAGMTCTVAGTINSNEACKLTGTAHMTAVQSQTCATSCTQPFEVDLANAGFPIDTSNCMINFGIARAGGGWATQTFSTQIRDISIAAQPTGHGATQPNVLICNWSAEENSGTPASMVQIFGDAGGYTGTTGAFIYNGPWAPNSNWSHIALSGGPTATANPFWAVIIDGNPTSPPIGGASGGTRQMTDNTLNLRGGATVDGAILVQGNRASVGVSDSHSEILNGNDAYVVTAGAKASFTHSEAFTTGIGLHITASAGMVEVNAFCNQGTNSSNQERCTPAAVSIQDDTVGGTAISLKGPINHYSSGMSIAKVVQMNPMTFANLTSIFACAAGTEGAIAAITDDLAAVAFNTIITGGGASHVHGYCNGTNWVMQ